MAVASPLDIAQEALYAFRVKYPQYAKIDDTTLATKIAEKYPVYRDTFAPFLRFQTARALLDDMQQKGKKPSDLNPKGQALLSEFQAYLQSQGYSSYQAFRDSQAAPAPQRSVDPSLLTPQGRQAMVQELRRLFIEDPSLPPADPYGTRRSAIGEVLWRNVIGPSVALGPTMVAKGVGERIIGQTTGELARRVAPRIAPVIAAAQRFVGRRPSPVPTAPPIGSAVQGVGQQQALLETAPAARPAPRMTAWDTAAQAPGLARSMLSSGDLSGWLRQAAFIAPRYPVQFARNLLPSAKALFSEKAFQATVRDVTERATLPLMERGGLALSALDNIPLTAREEAYVAVDLVKRIPILRNWIRASERSYSGFLTKLRADVFDSIVRDAEKSGTALTDDALKAIAGFVNTATGRGDLAGLASSANALATVLFSPRLAASRLQLMNPAYYARLHPAVRKQALESALAFYGLVTTVLATAGAAGAQVITDHRRNDFGQIRIGNVRYDITGGFASYFKFFGQLTSGEALSATTGEQITIRGRPLSRWQILQRFVESKFAPSMRAARDILEGESFGQPVTVKQQIASNFVPIILQDMFQLYEAEGLIGIPMGVPAFFGVGVQTYRPR